MQGASASVMLADMNVWPDFPILKFLHIDGLSLEGSVSQDEWTALLHSAAVQPASVLGLQGGGEVSGNLVAFSETDLAWVAAFAETAMGCGVGTVWWLAPEHSVAQEDAALLLGMGVVLCPRVSVRGLKLGPLRALLEGEAQRLKRVSGSVPPLVLVDDEDGLILKEARRAGFHRVVLEGSGVNPSGRRFWTCRTASHPTLETAWLDGSPRAAALVTAEGLSLKKARLRLGL